ncbi:SDR family NAD(P)-dependent oxidoreductase [Kitasatospora viridis]|uniref:NAD(P)-dependent dehydrogenase (Short-subunit alcohol dehydrogenase family) n=1 Tax=Kitasatospora viridis TaxID=281105 RepID=A0A561TTM5_9ACTN|nr:SDR family NAD(P)-dependent oxidoreductase [Kitasatospora viridis]TWF90448.1 NAD(P)-dependent dehydrogenase (short-subunit alcohol dehydrogenase family) [Kitasatospora viridis]
MPTPDITTQHPTTRHLTDSVALVTGANRGIGREIAAQLAALGCTVLAGSRKPPGEPAGDARIQHVRLDVTDPADIAAAAEWIEASYGRLDVLVNNAGVSGPLVEQNPSTIDTAVLREVFETNVFAVLSVTNALLPLLRRSPAGRIVNVTSGVASLGRHTELLGTGPRWPLFGAYAPSKSALNALTVQYAKELRPHGILVNAVAPGACATDFVQGLSFADDITRTAAEGAAVAVKFATLPPGAEGPSGGFFDEDGPVPW